MPVRVQRKRTKGFKLPINTVCVTRGTKWGNPFTFGDFLVSLTLLASVRRIENHEVMNGEGLKWILESYKKYMQENPELVALAKKELKGKNLACWCGLNDGCHADILLEIANS